ncbi:MAG TPA: PIG-L family deacetylase [Phycisphaerae bacterium]|nr:PIG-L family deacetylase [Phycisphaerae bacterium]
MAKKSESFEFVRLVESERRVGPTLASVSRHWNPAEERFLFISPHDDDVAIGGALMIQAALADNVPVDVAVVTDGAQGYCSLEEKDTISDIRRRETFAAYKLLGVPKENIHWVGYPDCQLSRYVGRRPATSSDPVQSHGYTGLQHTFVELLRRLHPNQVFLPTVADLHPDHRMVHSEMLISCFHASGTIWPELGPPLKAVPYIHELAVYCNFPAKPKLRVEAPDAAMRRKLKAIAAFKSQKQIDKLVEILERGGPWEYLRPVDFALYNPSVYRDQFDEPPRMRTIFR